MLRQKAAALERTGAFFGLAIDEARAAAIAAGPIFKSHSKRRGQDFDDAVRDEERAEMQRAHGEEIGMVAQWTKVVAEQFSIPMALPAALI